SSRPFSPPANDRGPTPDLGRPTNTFAAAPPFFPKVHPILPYSECEKAGALQPGIRKPGSAPALLGRERRRVRDRASHSILPRAKRPHSGVTGQTDYGSSVFSPHRRMWHPAARAAFFCPVVCRTCPHTGSP